MPCLTNPYGWLDAICHARYCDPCTLPGHKRLKSSQGVTKQVMRAMMARPGSTPPLTPAGRAAGTPQHSRLGELEQPQEQRGPAARTPVAQEMLNRLAAGQVGYSSGLWAAAAFLHQQGGLWGCVVSCADSRGCGALVAAVQPAATSAVVCAGLAGPCLSQDSTVW